MFKKIFIAAAIGAVAMGAQASTNLVSNGEMNGTTSDYIYNAAPGTVTSNYGAVPTDADTVGNWDGSFVSIASNSSPWGNPSGLANFDAATQGGYVAGVQADGTLSQTLNLAEGEYTLTWVTANRGNANQNYLVQFGGTTIDNVTTTEGAGWTTESVTFTTAGGTGLSFVGQSVYNSSNDDATSFIDNVSVTAVPEPASLLMMAVGTLGLLAWRRRAQV